METLPFAFGRRASEYHLFTEGVDRSRPVGVVVRLHGDGDDEFRHPNGLLASLARVAAERNMILAAPLTPHRKRGCTWWRKPDRNIAWLDAFFRSELLTIPGVDPVDIWWYGYSGGAEMFSYGTVPSSQLLVTGGALMLGGGGPPEALDDPLPDAAKRKKLPLTWAVGEFDDGTTSEDHFDALTAAREGADWYRSEGFGNVRLEIVPGCDHYNVPQPQLLASLLDAHR